MTALAQQRCLVHQDREAAVRCTECRRFYCRECVTEHSGRMLCAHCITQSESAGGRRSVAALWGMLSLTGFFFAWVVFYYLGMVFARNPASFHGGRP